MVDVTRCSSRGGTQDGFHAISETARFIVSSTMASIYVNMNIASNRLIASGRTRCFAPLDEIAGIAAAEVCAG